MKAIEKELKRFNFPQILVDLHRKQKTGTLTVNTDDVTKKVYMEKGNAVFASSTDEDERLGETLIKLGKLTIEQYDRSVELLKETGKRQGTILVELGYLTPKDLVMGVKSQVREIIYSLFLVEDAEYEFDEGELPNREVITLLMSMGNLIYEGIKRINNVVRVKRELPDMNAVLRLNEDPESFFQDIVFSHRDKATLAMIDGTKTVKEIIDSTSSGTFEAMKTLYVLYVAGFVEKQEKVEESEEQTMVSAEPVQSLHTEEEAFVERVNELYSNLYKLDAHDLLEIDEKSDANTVQRNFYRLLKEFHPDQYGFSTDPLMLDKLIIISEEIQNAYMLLKEDDKRSDYFREISKSSEDTVSEPPQRKYTVEEQAEDTFEQMNEEIISSIKAYIETDNDISRDDIDTQGQAPEDTPVNRQLLNLIEEIKALLQELRKELPGATGPQVSGMEEQEESESTKELPYATGYENIVLPEKPADLEQEVSPEESKNEPQAETIKKKKLKLWHVLIPVLFLIAATVSFLFIYTPEKQQIVRQPVQAKKEILAPATKTQEVPPQPAPEVKKVSPVAATQAVQHTIELIATDSTWLSATIDEKESKEMILKPGDRIKWTAKSNISLIIGNAEGLKVIFDGKELGPLGGKGKVVKLKLPASKNS